MKEKLRLSQETGFAVHVISTSSSTSTSHDTLVRPGEGIDNSMGVLYLDSVSKKGRLACAPCGELSKMVISAPDLLRTQTRTAKQWTRKRFKL